MDDPILSTLLWVVAIVAGAACVRVIGSKIIKEHFKTKRKAIALERKLSKDSVKKRENEFFESVLKSAIDGIEAVTGIGVISVAVLFCGYFLIPSMSGWAQVEKNISYQSTEISKTSEKLDKISDDISSIKNEIKSLNDRFQLFIDLFSSSRTAPTPEERP